jgi:hypothetical protein
MKKRRTFLGLFMLLSLAFVGVGYAALTNTLKVNGTLNATKNDENLNVQFIASQATAKHKDGSEDTAFTVTHSASDKTATVNVNGINELDSYAEVCYVIKNNSKPLVGTVILDAVVSTELDIKMLKGSEDITGNDQNLADKNVFKGNHFSVEGRITNEYDENDATYGTVTDDDDYSDKFCDLGVNEVCFLVVRVTLIAPILDTFDTHTFTISFNASTVDQITEA